MDRELVSRAQGGDHDAFSALAAESIGHLTAVARLILRDGQAADDAVQETLVDAWRGVRGLRDPDRFEAWLHRLLMRACSTQARRSWGRRVVELRVLPSDAATSSDMQRAVVIHDQLERALARLEPEKRAVLVRTYYLDLPLAEAARILDIPIGTMKSRLNRSLEAMRSALDADERQPAVTKEWSA